MTMKESESTYKSQDFFYNSTNDEIHYFDEQCILTIEETPNYHNN